MEPILQRTYPDIICCFAVLQKHRGSEQTGWNASIPRIRTNRMKCERANTVDVSSGSARAASPDGQLAANGGGWRAGSLNIRGETTVRSGPELHAAFVSSSPFLPFLPGDWARDKICCNGHWSAGQPCPAHPLPHVKLSVVPVGRGSQPSRLRGCAGIRQAIFWKELVPGGMPNDIKSLAGNRKEPCHPVTLVTLSPLSSIRFCHFVTLSQRHALDTPSTRPRHVGASETRKVAHWPHRQPSLPFRKLSPFGR